LPALGFIPTQHIAAIAAAPFQLIPVRANAEVTTVDPRSRLVGSQKP